MAAAKAVSTITKGLSNIIRDLKPKPATKSGKKARRRMKKGLQDKPLTKTAKKQNITQRPDKTLATEGKGNIAKTSEEQQAIVRRPPKGRPGAGQTHTITGKDGKLSKTAAAAEKRVKARERRRAATQAGVGTTAAAVAATPFIGDDDKEASAKSSSKSYTIKKGDTLSEIARDSGTTLKKLKEANPQIKDLNKIKPGQKINIPAKVPKRKSVYQGMSKSEMKKIDKSKKRYGGKVVKRMGGGQVMSGNDLVSSLYD